MAKRTICILGILLFFFLAMPALAQEGTVTDDEVNEIAKDLFCPVCESVPLDVCPTQACADWRELIRTQLAEGKTKDEIHDYFARQYGDGVLADPPKRGFNLILWILPVVAVLGGGIFFWRYLKGLRETAATATPTSTPVVDDAVDTAVPPDTSPKDDTDYLNQVEEELQNL